MKFDELAEIRVERAGARIGRVLFDACDGSEPIELPARHVIAIERLIESGELPRVRVSFIARIVEENA